MKNEGMVEVRDLFFNDEMLFGQDFSQVWVAGKLVNAGLVDRLFSLDAFNDASHRLLERSYPGGIWSYPPTALLVAAPMALLPYNAAVCVWAAIQAAICCLTGVLATRPRLDPARAAMVAITSPALILSCLFGQFSIPVGCLAILAIFLLETRPVLAGVLVGLMAVKPQFGVVPAIVLLAAGEWRAIFAASGTVAAMALGVAALWGVDVWPRFITDTLPAQVANMANLENYRPVAHSVRDCLVLVGVPHDLAMAAQIAAGLLAVVVCVLVVRRDRNPRPRAFVVCVASVLILPYTNIYDQAIPAMGALALYGSRENLSKLVLAGLYVIWLGPVLDIFLGGWGLLKISPFVGLIVLAGFLRPPRPAH